MWYSLGRYLEKRNEDMGLGSLSFLNIQQLQSRAMQYESSSSDVTDSSDEHASVADLIEMFLGDDYSEVTLTNNYAQKSSDVGLYTLIISRRGMRLLERCSIKKSEFILNLDGPELLLNRQRVDVSFLGSFYQKLTKVISDYNRGQLTINGKCNEEK